MQLDVVAEVPVDGVVLGDGLIAFVLGLHQVQTVVVPVVVGFKFAAHDDKRWSDLVGRHAALVDVKAALGVVRVVLEDPPSAGNRILKFGCRRDNGTQGDV